LTYGYPGSICVSVDDEVVHGIPGRRVLQRRELVSLDVAAEVDGYHADAAVTMPVGPVDRTAPRLIVATRAALSAGMQAAQPGATLRDVGAAIEQVALARGYRILRELIGHGIGHALHEEPTVCNWPAPETTTHLSPGLMFTTEPMLTAGRTRLVLDRDACMVRTADGSLSANAEHTIMVANNGSDRAHRCRLITRVRGRRGPASGRRRVLTYQRRDHTSMPGDPILGGTLRAAGPPVRPAPNA
jgi:methionyl aminopeptidase